MSNENTSFDLCNLLCKYGSENSEDEAKFLDTKRSPCFTQKTYFPIENKDNVINQLIEKNNELESRLQTERETYELKIKNLQASLETVREYTDNSKLQDQSQQFHKIIRDLTTQNSALKLELKQLRESPPQMNTFQRQSSSEELQQQNAQLQKQIKAHQHQILIIKQQVIKELNIIKGMALSQISFKQEELRQKLDTFINATVCVDEQYYTLLEQLDDRILKKEMPVLEKLNQNRKESLDEIYSYLDSV